MNQEPFNIEYSQDLNRLSELLLRIDRPGNFMVAGAWQGPLPRVDIEGLGTLAFPLLDVQAEALAAVASAAPYGRGEETLFDESVRNTRQLDAARVYLSGATWQKTLDDILHQVTEGLGCADLPVRPEPYKLLLYQTGGFFAPHRDTEKAEGMFGTLVMTLPSFHTGGDLIIRHKDHEERVSLIAQDVSEIRYAAFYADCVHEVLPVTEGYRLCLVYNLILAAEAPRERAAAPDYDDRVEQVAGELAKWSRSRDTMPKIAWLLDHDYTPAGLSFVGLKSIDAARADVLLRAAEQAGCALHLATVHIEEYGPAILEYDGYDRFGRYGGEEDASDDDFEIVEVSDGRQFITGWQTRDGETADFGELPLLEGELLPAGALDDEAPDEQRVTEATGNEGASFERAYHRAALVLWPEDRATEVLLQSGTGAAVTHLEQTLRRTDLSRAEDREGVLRIARTIMEQWEGAAQWNWRARCEESGLGRFLEAVARLDDAVLTTACLETVALEYRSPGMHVGLVACLKQLPAAETRRLGGELMKAHATALPAECIQLLDGLTRAVSDPAGQEFVACELLAALPREEEPRSHWDWFDEDDEPISTTLCGEHLATLLLALRRIGSDQRIAAALELVRSHPGAYPGDGMLIPALKELREKLHEGAQADPSYTSLWHIATEFFLERSATAPAEPTDWIQPLPPGCQCTHCKALMKFAADPVAKVARFPLRKDLRRHLHRRIDEANMDMTHETERKGRPYTLVCTKTRLSHEHRLLQYQEDLKAMRLLRHHAPADAEEIVAQLATALANLPSGSISPRED